MAGFLNLIFKLGWENFRRKLIFSILFIFHPIYLTNLLNEFVTMIREMFYHSLQIKYLINTHTSCNENNVL